MSQTFEISQDQTKAKILQISVVNLCVFFPVSTDQYLSFLKFSGKDKTTKDCAVLFPLSSVTLYHGTLLLHHFATFIKFISSSKNYAM